MGRRGRSTFTFFLIFFPLLLICAISIFSPPPSPLQSASVSELATEAEEEDDEIEYIHIFPGRAIFVEVSSPRTPTDPPPLVVTCSECSPCICKSTTFKKSTTNLLQFILQTVVPMLFGGIIMNVIKCKKEKNMIRCKEKEKEKQKKMKAKCGTSTSSSIWI